MRLERLEAFHDLANSLASGPGLPRDLGFPYAPIAPDFQDQTDFVGVPPVPVSVDPPSVATGKSMISQCTAV